MIKYKYKRIVIVILDSVGCGFLPDYKKFNKTTSNTLLNLYKNQKKFALLNLERMGLKQLIFGEDIASVCFIGKMNEKSMGNDTFAGVSEMLGYTIKQRFRSIHRGLSNKTIRKIEVAIGNKIVGNEYISGFKALDKYYYQHKRERAPILYLADDGVILLAAHENIIRPDTLNFYGEKIALLLRGEKISRVITRPFIGLHGNFFRTEHRRDYLTQPDYKKNLIISKLLKKGIHIITTEHINKLIGCPQGVKCLKGNHNNDELITKIIRALSKAKQDSVMLFCLQDFDMFGHKKDPIGYGKSLLKFDSKIPKIINKLRNDDLLIITADHGCDPYADIRGHTREYVPLIIYSKRFKNKKGSLGIRETFADIGKTICYNYNLPLIKNGKIIYEIF